jgi:hypothetical protein
MGGVAENLRQLLDSLDVGQVEGHRKVEFGFLMPKPR